LIPGCPPNVRVISPDLLADIFGVPEKERVRWEQVVDWGQQFDEDALQVEVSKCDRNTDQAEHDQDYPPEEPPNLGKYFPTKQQLI